MYCATVFNTVCKRKMSCRYLDTGNKSMDLINKIKQFSKRIVYNYLEIYKKRKYIPRIIENKNVN